jgi:hypothetical protein
MDIQPMIFSVMQWTENVDKTWKLDVHLVAGFDSVDAEKRFLGFERDSVRGHLFINADPFMNSYGKSTRTYSTRYRNDDRISVEDYRRWIQRSLLDSDNDGDFYPAAFRALGQFK